MALCFILREKAGIRCILSIVIKLHMNQGKSARDARSNYVWNCQRKIKGKL